jgi:hypothetical protein
MKTIPLRIPGWMMNALLLMTSWQHLHAQERHDPVFQDALTNGWVLDRWGDDSSGTIQSATKKNGTHALEANTAGWGGITLDRRSQDWQSISTITHDEYTHLHFWIAAPSPVLPAHNSLVITLNTDPDSSVALRDYVSIESPNTWYQVNIPLSALNPTRQDYFQLVFFNDSDTSELRFFVDDVMLFHDGSEPVPPAVLDFNIDGAATSSTISPYIYGVNFALATERLDPTLRQRFANRAGMHREGGNRWSAYNWENNASNAGSDYIHHSDNYIAWRMGIDNQPQTPGLVVQAAGAFAQADRAALLVTIPMLDYVAADTDGTVPESQIPSGPGQTNLSRWNVNLARKGAPLSTQPNLQDKYVYQEEFVNWLETVAFPAEDRLAPIYYCLDNEPALWPGTHARNHPKRPTYTEMIERTTAFASMIKDRAPQSLVFGAVTYGWNEMVSLQGAADAQGRDYLSFFLDSMKSAETQFGKRLVDVIDIHWYPEAQGGGTRISGAFGPGLSDAEIEAIVQTPRSYWDPGYAENSWVSDYVSGGYNGRNTIALLPRLKDQVNLHYPGTRLAITEYVSGGDLHIAGGVAQADNLGIFGREGLFAATYWPLIDPSTYASSYTFGAYACFLNYNGNGAFVGDQLLSADNPDASRASLYAMRQTGESERLCIIAINKTQNPLPARIHANGFQQTFRSWKVYCMQDGEPNPLPAGHYSMHDNHLSYMMPPLSVTTLELSTQEGGEPPPVLPGENQAPILDPVGNRSSAAGETIRITLEATDADEADTLTYSASAAP